MVNTKQCKQCGRTLTLPNFRSYYPRGAAAQKVREAREAGMQPPESKVGCSTVCKECEAFNAKVNRIYKLDMRTQEQQSLLDEAATFYKALASRGLEPKGRYAADVLSLSTDSSNKDKSKSSIQEARNFMRSLLAPTASTASTGDAPVVEGQKLLKLVLTQEPDIYQQMVDDWREKIVGPDGRVKAEYLELFNAVAERFDDYEDNYQW